MFINTNGRKDKLGKELKNLLEYINTNEPKDSFTAELDTEVQELRNNEHLSMQYAVYIANLNDERSAGYSEGYSEGERDTIIAYATFCIDNGIPKEKVIERIACDLGCSMEEAEEFFYKEISKQKNN